MAEGLRLIRTKTTAGPDPDPRAGVFTPPRSEIFQPASQAKGYRIGLVYGADGFTSTILVYARNSTDGTWFLAGSRAAVGNRILYIQDDIGSHDLWIGFTSITGGTPIQVWMEENN